MRKNRVIIFKPETKLMFFFFLFQISLAFFDPSSCLAENQNFPDRLNRHFFNHLLTNTKDIFTSPQRWDKSEWLTVSLASAATAAFLPVDNSIHNWVHNNRTGTTDSVSKVFSAAGGPAVLLGIISVGYLYGELADRPGARQTFLLAGECLLLTELVVQIGKIGLGRARPYTEEGAFSFHPFNFKEKWHSFPSGHAASAWALSACLASRSSSPYLDAVLYTVAAGISLSRIFLDKHFASDVVAASLLGYFIGKKVSQHSKPTENKPALALVVNRGIIALSLNYSY